MRALAVFAALPLLGLATGAQAQVACTAANADGSYTVPYDWALKPSGLARGANFRLLFVTSTQHQARSGDIASYNTIVQTRAKAGHSAITDSCGNRFRIVGSTSTVSARANTDTESTDTDAPIYWLNGAKVADNHADFYDGSWDDRTAKNESGANRGNVRVWTGSYAGGTSHPSQYLGASSARRGRTAHSSPLSSGASGTGFQLPSTPSPRFSRLTRQPSPSPATAR